MAHIHDVTAIAITQVPTPDAGLCMTGFALHNQATTTAVNR
jgi:hypothetical protein